MQLALGAAKELEASGVAVRVVSMPCCEVFDAQPTDYRASVLPPRRRAPRDRGRRDGRLVALCRARAAASSASIPSARPAPAKAVFEHFGFTVAAVAEHARRLL